jgi:flagellar basal body-associated protein FliL
VSQQTIVAVALTLAVVALILGVVLLMAARSIAMAMTSQAEKTQVFEALKNKARSWRTVDFYKESD